MKVDRKLFSLLVVAAAAIALASLFALRSGNSESKKIKKTKGEKKMSSHRVKLPEPDTKGKMTVEKAISLRRSQRDFTDDSLTLQQLGQLLWSLQGCTGAGCLKAAPSAGATYPLEIFAVVGAGSVKGLEGGVYHYTSEEHEIALHKEGDVRKELASAALGQAWVLQAPVSFIIAADYSRTTTRYGERGIRYVHVEVGHAGENLYLQAQSLGLGTVAVGAYSDKSVAAAVGVKKPLEVFYIMPVGKTKM